MVHPLRAAFLQDRKYGPRMPEENPGRSSLHFRVSRRAIGCTISLALLFARDSLSNGFIRVPGRSHDFPQSRVRIGSLTQDDRPESRGQRILVLQGRVGDAQALRRIAGFRSDHRFSHERIGDGTRIRELQGVIECPVCEVHRTYQIPGVLENPPTELRKLASKPEHLGPVGPPSYLAGPFDDRHLKLDRAGNAYRPHQLIRLDIATIDSAKRRQHRDGASPRQVAEQRSQISHAGARDMGWPSSGGITGSGSLRSQPQRPTRGRRHPQAISERLERRGGRRHALMRLVLAQAPLRYACEARELPLGKALRAQKFDHCAEVTALTRLEHVPARADALHYLPDSRVSAMPENWMEPLPRVSDRACLHKRPSYCLSKSSGHAIPTGNTKTRSLYLVTVLMLCPMVRRRSTVRFRNGAPVQGNNSNLSNRLWEPFRGPIGPGSSQVRAGIASSGPRSYPVRAVLSWTCSTARRIIGVARWMNRLTRCP